MTVRVRQEAWPLRTRFAISRGARTEARVVVAEVEAGPHRGRGECTPYARYEETVGGVMEAIREAARRLGGVAGEVEEARERLQELLPPGAARNALDTALWELEAARRGIPVRERLGLGAPGPVPTFVTVSLDEPRAMAASAERIVAGGASRLKLKLGGEGDVERVAAVRRAAPRARIMVDANEAWTVDELPDRLRALRELGVELVEQPLPASDDGALEGYAPPVPLCADESCHDRGDLAVVAARYQVVNLKLDKTGGLTEALRLAEASRERGLGVMVGCMLGTSLAMAPALLLAERAGAEVVDLDAPLFLGRDRSPALAYEGGEILSPPPGHWGDGTRRAAPLQADSDGEP